MKQFVPLEKMNKKAKKELCRARRGTWGILNPVTRRSGNAKIYNRKKVQREEKFFDAGPFLCI